jgi:hypothetical protein
MVKPFSLGPNSITMCALWAPLDAAADNGAQATLGIVAANCLVPQHVSVFVFIISGFYPCIVRANLCRFSSKTNITR